MDDWYSVSSHERVVNRCALYKYTVQPLPLVKQHLASAKPISTKHLTVRYMVKFEDSGA